MGNRQEKRMTGEYPDYHAVLNDMLTNRSLPFKQAIIDKLYQERVSEKLLPFNSIRADIIELLADLRTQHIKIGLISNCTEEEVQYWGKANFHRILMMLFSPLRQALRSRINKFICYLVNG